MLTQTGKHKFFRQIMWVYQVKPEDIHAVFDGKTDRAGHCSKEALFVKLFGSYSWYTILKNFCPELVLTLLTDSVINKSKKPSLKRQLEFLRKRLQEIIPLTG